MSVTVGGTTPLKAIYAGNRPIVRRYVGADLVWQARRLPLGYQEVEWIESDGGCWLDTGVNYSMSDVFNIGIRTDSALTTGFITGANATDTEPDIFILSRDAPIFQFYARPSSGITFRPNTDYNIVLQNGSVRINGVGYAIAQAATISPSKIVILAALESGGSATTDSRRYKGRLYYFSVLGKTDCVPCYRVSDGVVGLYDLVGATFITKQGGGILTKGPDVA